jgi:hypothetical protein
LTMCWKRVRRKRRGEGRGKVPQSGEKSRRAHMFSRRRTRSDTKGAKCCAWTLETGRRCGSGAGCREGQGAQWARWR